MPAVTVDDITKLPHIPLPDPTATQARPVVSVTTAPHGLEGEGFPVRRAFAGADPRLLDPFVHMDQMGEVEYAPGEPKGTPWHPHRGFETVTYMIDGTFQHQDSNGGGGVITNGDNQWMTAGAGDGLLRFTDADFAGHSGPGITYSPISLAHVTVAPGARLLLPWPRDFNALIYVLAGNGTAGAEPRP